MDAVGDQHSRFFERNALVGPSHPHRGSLESTPVREAFCGRARRRGHPLRLKLGIGVLAAEAAGPNGAMAKAKIAKLLGIEINAVRRCKEETEKTD